jgi:hypothetical protein
VLEVLSMQVDLLSISILINLLGFDLRHFGNEVLEDISLFFLLRMTVVQMCFFFQVVVTTHALEGVLIEVIHAVVLVDVVVRSQIINCCTLLILINC